MCQQKRPDYVVYLSSTSYGRWKRDGFNWKKDFTNQINRKTSRMDVRIMLIDPLLKSSEEPEVVDIDLYDINSSNCVVCYIDKISIGTMMELSYCVFNKIPIYLITKNKKVTTHPWIRRFFEGKICETIDEVSEIVVNDIKNLQLNKTW